MDDGSRGAAPSMLADALGYYELLALRPGKQYSVEEVKAAYRRCTACSQVLLHACCHGPMPLGPNRSCLSVCAAVTGYASSWLCAQT